MRIPEYGSFIPGNGIIGTDTISRPRYSGGVLSLLSKYDSGYGAEVVLHASRQLLCWFDRINYINEVVDLKSLGIL